MSVVVVNKYMVYREAENIRLEEIAWKLILRGGQQNTFQNGYGALIKIIMVCNEYRISCNSLG